MNEHRFIELLAAYGAELSRWPVEDRLAAEELLEFGPHRLKDLWESERVFDRLLALEKDTPASISLETKVLASSNERKRAQARTGWRMPQWATGGAVAASLALGFAVGYAAEPPVHAQPQASQTLAANEVPQMLALNEGGSAAVLLSEVTNPD